MNREEMYAELLKLGLKVEIADGDAFLVSHKESTSYACEYDGYIELKGCFTAKQLRAISMWMGEE